MTDEELNKIASRLRRTSNDTLGGESLQRALARITVAEDASWRGVMRRIADLIECGVANRVETMYDTYCSHCGRHLDMDMDFCPACGGKIKYREERCDGRGWMPGDAGGCR